MLSRNSIGDAAVLNSKLRGIDFAALETLRIVHRRLSFSAAAVELDVKQSSVSYTIDRLRKAFSDPLFVRQGNTISPTERCEEIVEAAQHILGTIELAALPSDFEPGAIQASITISATYWSRSVLMPQFVRELRREAPGISIELITGFTDASEHLLSGRADFALSPVSIEDSGIYGAPLFVDPYVCLMDPDNALAGHELTPEGFASAPHLIIHYGQRWHPLYHSVLKELGLEMDVAVSTPDPEDVRFLIPGTDLVVAMPSRMARQFAEGLHITTCPVPSTAKVNLYWPARLNHSPLQRWLREKVMRHARDLADD
jgi:DNA-binding transcriptional LysR family regulator